MRYIVFDQLNQLIHGVKLKIGRIRDEYYVRGDNIVAYEIASGLEHARHLIDMPIFVRRILLHGYEHVGRAVGLEFGLARLEKIHELIGHLDYVRFVDESEA
jgi:hypothetical protein